MSKSDNPKKLIVEGYDDLFSVSGLMRHHIEWPKETNAYPVFIIVGNSIDEILEPDYITTSIKDSTTVTLGFMLDADGDAAARYSSFKHHCKNLFPNLPKDLPASGLIADNDEGKRIGLWIMPDNSSNGALELFLKYLVPDTNAEVWQLAVKCVTEAKKIGAKYRVCHTDKSNLYTWLAWQDDPGQTPGMALTRKILDPNAPYAAPFVKWFMELYALQPSLSLNAKP